MYDFFGVLSSADFSPLWDIKHKETAVEGRLDVWCCKSCCFLDHESMITLHLFPKQNQIVSIYNMHALVEKHTEEN